MKIYPAIDLRDGKCVRLYQGDYQQETIYSADPFAQVDTFMREGATEVHLIDLDGAKNPAKNQEALILALLKQGKVSIQIGGGIRSAAQIEKYLESGAARVIVGSLAVTSPETVLAWFKRFGADNLVLALDIVYNAERTPLVATNAWQTTSPQTPESLIEIYQAAALKHVLCTDITRDGTLQGPNIALYEVLLSQFPYLKIQASGGIQALSDLVFLREKGLSAAISGRALYEHKFTLREALSC
ncbi:MAG: 1-(5-phosphoribosyl)-5-[(5-phosphoribosylamino)methylideneamino]imidazole-4-carboxamide isomerase [Legionellaceae bacterium]|nr:1-(5-phosphoribosyl)-5-[(5-phosphoribosylamino)methylideneamino]imidazole-4-carboxamide isomerase [Legionellaceae bacterium]